MDFMTEEERIFAQTLDKDILAQFKRHVHAIWRPIRVAQAALDQRVADLEELGRSQADRITHLEREKSIAEMSSTAKMSPIDRVRQSIGRRPI